MSQQSSSSQTKSPSKDDIFLAKKVAMEILVMIFKELDVASSVCFGLTCKRIWEQHMSLHSAVVPLQERTTFPDGEIDARLHCFLRTWMYTNAKLVWGGKYNLTFITEERRTREEKAISQLKRKYLAHQSTCGGIDPCAVSDIFVRDDWQHFTTAEIIVKSRDFAYRAMTDFGEWSYTIEELLKYGEIVKKIKKFTVVKEQLQEVLQRLVENNTVLDMGLPDPGHGAIEDDDWLFDHIDSP